jgi:hypothetical protein
MSIDAEKEFGTTSIFMIKIFRITGIEENLYNLIKSIYQNTTNITVDGEVLNVFPHCSYSIQYWKF